MHYENASWESQNDCTRQSKCEHHWIKYVVSRSRQYKKWQRMGSHGKQYQTL
jgi:hypothetical protein